MLLAERDPELIGIPLTTSYRDWEPSTKRGQQLTSDNVRGDLALRTCENALRCGYQVMVFDTGSSAAFKDSLVSTGVVSSASSGTP